MKAMNLNDFKIEKNSLQFVKQSIKKKRKIHFKKQLIEKKHEIM